MKIHIDIDLEIAPRTRSVLTHLVAPALIVLGSGAIAHADVMAFGDGETLTAEKLNTNFSNLQNQVNALVPPGTIIAYGGVVDGNPLNGNEPANPPPAGWLWCNGDLVSGEDPLYAPLYSALGTTFGSLPTPYAFNIPDLRGTFLRGQGTQVYEGRTYAAAPLGQHETDELRLHGHSVTDPGHQHTRASPGYQCPGGAGSESTQGSFQVEPHACTGIALTGVSIDETGGPETRPFSTTVNYLIKL